MNEISKQRRWRLPMREIAALTLSLGITLSGHAQISKDERVTLNFKNAPLEQVLKQIEKQTSYRFLYNKESVDPKGRFTITVNNADLEGTLIKLFQGKGISFKAEKNQIVLNPRQSESSQKPAKSAVASRTITGCITDKSDGEPLIGATILNKSTGAGAATDVEGNFTIKADEGQTLLVSYVGYTPQTVKVGSDSKYNILLAQNASQLEEVMVVGYGVQKKVNVTGSVSMVDAKTFEARPVTNVQQALQGAVPGLNLNVSGSGGELNSSMDMNIRGMGTIGSGSVAKPLVLIDGVEGDINTLNPADIESISALKDAASSSIYGSRAAFGVILVTTKNAKAGQVSVNYAGDVRFSTATQIPDKVNSVEWANYFNAAQYNADGGVIFYPRQIYRMQCYLDGMFTDPNTFEYYGLYPDYNNDGKWPTGTGFANVNAYDEHFRKNVPSTNHSLSISGGNDKVTYFVSGNFMQQNGLIRYGHDQLDRYTINAKIGAQVFKWLRLDFNSKWTRTDYDWPGYIKGGLLYRQLMRYWPNYAFRTPNGGYTPKSMVKEVEQLGKNAWKDDTYTQQLSLTFTPLEGWNIIADGAVKNHFSRQMDTAVPPMYQNVYGEDYVGDTYYGANPYVGTIRTTDNYYTLNVFTNYTRSFGLHNAKALLGLNYEKFAIESMSASTRGLTNDEKPYLSNGLNYNALTDSYRHRSTAGYFGRLNYDYDGKYLLEFNLRYDGSSRFLANRRWAWFPSVSAGWNIAKEKFFREATTLFSTIKIRGSWGKLGNTSSAYSNFSDWYPFYQRQNTGLANSSWIINGEKQNTATVPDIVSSTMTWETVQTVDLGLDIMAFNNRLNVTFDWFTRRTNDMVGPAPVLGSVLGVDPPKTNNCDMRSDGWELEIGYNDRFGNVNFNARVNISDSRSKVTKYPYDGEFENQSYSNWYAGKVEGIIWGYETKGIAQSQEQMDAWLADNKPNWGSNWGAGDIMYVDRNGDGEVNTGRSTLADHGDLIIIGNDTPRYRFGVNLGAEWKGIDFSAFFQGVMKRDYLFGDNEPMFWGAAKGVYEATCTYSHLDYWTPDNPDAYFPKPYFTDTKNRQAQTRYLQDASYMRCKNMQLGYSLPAKWINKAHISRCRFYVAVDNLFTVTKLAKDFDPEVLTGSLGAGQNYPLTRTWSVGVNISFK